MSASEKLKALLIENDENDDIPLPIPQIVALVEATERGAAAIAVIRALGFVGNAHYCPDCMNHFHEDRGQHEPGCSVLAGLLEEGGWWERDDAEVHALSALDEALS